MNLTGYPYISGIFAPGLSRSYHSPVDCRLPSFSGRTLQACAAAGNSFAGTAPVEQSLALKKWAKVH